jgi:exonuclease VII small subunit
MDYTIVFRQLIYKDRKDIDEFPVDETDNTDFLTMESVFMEKLEARRFIKDSFNASELILMIFNNARYITTLIYSENHPQHYLHKYLKIAENDSRDIIMCNHAMPATMALVVNYLLHYLGESFFGSKIVKAIIENFNDWDTKGASEGKQDFYDLLIDRTSETDKYPRWAKDDGDFPRRDIKDVLNDTDIDPYEIIGDLDYIIQETFGMYSGEPECPLIMKAIKALMENFERTEQIHETTREMLDIAYQKLKKAYPHAGLKWEENVSTSLQSGFDVGGLDVSLQSSRMLNPLFDSEREELLGQIDDLKEEVNQLAREKATLEKSNRELQEMVNLCKSNIVIADDRKIDVIKVLHAMCKAELFKMKDGSRFTIKAVMEFFGEILNDNFSEYSSNLSTSKSTAKEDTFLEIFDKLRDEAKKYLNKS